MPKIEIGFLCSATDAAWKPYVDAFINALTPNVFNLNPPNPPNYLSAQGESSKYDTLAGQLAAIPNIKVIVTAGTEAALACKNAVLDPVNTAVVFASAGDPAGCKLVNSLTKPTGTNVIGCNNMQIDDTTVKKRIDVMKRKLPTKKKVLVVGHNPPGKPLCVIDHAMKKALSELGTQGIAGQWQADDFKTVANVKAKLTPLQDQVDVLLVCSDPVVSANVSNLIQAAHSLKMRTMHEFREHVDPPNNGNQCYGPSFVGLFTQAATIVNQIGIAAQPGIAAGALVVQTPNSYDEVP
jgi:ABC-type uncharacterized transport system substrate-binding protein